MALPQLTWQQRPLQSNGGGTAPSDILGNLVAYLATGPAIPFNVSVTASSIVPGGDSYVEIRFTTPPGDENFNILLCGNDVGSPTAHPDVAQIYSDGDKHNYDYTGSAGQGQLWLGCEPHGTALSAADVFTAAGPYQDPAAKFSRYVRWSHDSSIDNFWIVDNEEMLGFFIEMSNENIRGFIAGQCVIPLTDDAGYQISAGGDGRTPGMFTIGQNNYTMEDYWYGGGNGCFLHPYISNNVYIDHASACFVWDTDTGDVVGVTHPTTSRGLTITAPSTYNGAFRDRLGNLLSLPIGLTTRSNSITSLQTPVCVGRFRQVYFGDRNKARQVFQNQAGDDLGYYLSGSLRSDSTGVFLGNS